MVGGIPMRIAVPAELLSSRGCRATKRRRRAYSAAIAETSSGALDEDRRERLALQAGASPTGAPPIFGWRRGIARAYVRFPRQVVVRRAPAPLKDFINGFSIAGEAFSKRPTVRRRAFKRGVNWRRPRPQSKARGNTEVLLRAGARRRRPGAEAHMHARSLAAAEDRRCACGRAPSLKS